MVAPRTAALGQRARLDAQDSRLADASASLLLPSDWQTLSLRHGTQTRSYARGSSGRRGRVAGPPACAPACPQLQALGAAPDYLLVLQRDGRTLATLTLAGSVLQGNLAVEGVGPQAVEAADAAGVARFARPAGSAGGAGLAYAALTCTAQS